jgi:L-ascorbate metabolism protein UlaG (beta-lactamase superfamily)
VGIGLGLLTAGPRRLVAPALEPWQLPKIDLMLVSHAHFDHLDRPSLCRLSKRVPVITSEHNGDLIRDLGYRKVNELRWGESAQFNGAKITAREVRHWGARTFFDRHRGFNAFLIEAGGKKILYGGDTAYHDYFKDIGPVDLAIFGIGAYDPYIQAHANPEQAMAMANHVKAKRILPMHHSTFRLSHEPIDEPLERMLEAAGPDTSRLCITQVGGQFSN